jgi:hypothetical protein
VTTIHIEEGQPENGWWRVRFIMTDGAFTEDDLAAVRARTRGWTGCNPLRPSERSVEGIGCFEGRNPARLVLTYSRGIHSRPAREAMRVLRVCYPGARFTTYSNSTKELFGDQVEQIRYTPRS